MDPTLVDSTQSGLDATDSGTADTAGRIGRARIFDGNNDYVQVTNPSGTDGLFVSGGTVSAWIRLDGWGGNQFGRVVDKTANTAGANGWALFVDGTTGDHKMRFGRTHQGAVADWGCPPGTLVLDSWYSVAAVYDEGSTSGPQLYIDGVPQSVQVLTAPSGPVADDSGTPMRIGNEATGTARTFDGRIDEVRLSTVARSAEWIAAQHRSMTDTMVTIGDEQTR